MKRFITYFGALGWIITGVEAGSKAIALADWSVTLAAGACFLLAIGVVLDDLSAA